MLGVCRRGLCVSDAIGGSIDDELGEDRVHRGKIAGLDLTEESAWLEYFAQ
jgi:hypothetical protein